jgi:hypothetical protein
MTSIAVQVGKEAGMTLTVEGIRALEHRLEMIEGHIRATDVLLQRLTARLARFHPLDAQDIQELQQHNADRLQELHQEIAEVKYDGQTGQ